MFIAKFGGSILNGADGVRRACDEIAQLPRPLLVVVSAFADVTNQLERLAETALRDLPAARDQLAGLFRDHADVARALMPESGFKEWSSGVAEWKIRLDQVIEGLSIVGELSPRTLDLIVHFGERLSSSLISSLLGVPSIPATDLLITDTAHRYARVDVELSRERVEEQLRPLLQKDKISESGKEPEGRERIVITEGYIARGTDGEVTTMGRESSDFSAAFLGELLGASQVRIYTGVPGVMTADPKLIPEAGTISAMSYGMARELAVLGAKVLHPRTVRPVERGGIPLTITDLNGAATVIGRAGNDDTFSIAAIPEAVLVAAELRQTGEGVDRFVSELSRTAPVVRLSLSGRELRVVTAVPPSNLAEAVAAAGGGIVRWSASSASLISLVRERRIDAGDGLAFVSAIDNDSLVSFWTDPDERSISALVRPERLENVVRKLHSGIMNNEVG